MKHLALAFALALVGCSTYGHEDPEIAQPPTVIDEPPVVEEPKPDAGGQGSGSLCPPGSSCNPSSCNPICADGFVCSFGNCISVLTYCK